MTKRQRQLIKKYENNPCWLGNPDFFAYWTALRTEIYEERKKQNLPDPLDIFDDYEGPVFKEKK